MCAINFVRFRTLGITILRNRHDAAGSILGGWQLSGILTAHTGFPWTRWSASASARADRSLSGAAGFL